VRRPIGFLVWNPSRGVPTVQHETLAKAEAEAERLRALHPDETFWVMSPVTSARAKSAAGAFSDGKAEGLAQAHAEIMLAEGRADRASDELHRLRRELSDFSHFRGDTAADCLLWFDGFNAAHAHKEGWERPRTPDREKLQHLNAALQRLVPGAVDDEDIPF